VNVSPQPVSVRIERRRFRSAPDVRQTVEALDLDTSEDRARLARRFGQVSFGQVSFGQVSFGQVSFGQVSFGQFERRPVGRSIAEAAAHGGDPRRLDLHASQFGVASVGEMEQIRNLDEVFAGFDAIWEPRIVASVNDYDVRIARVDGDHTWHSHSDTDEFFLVLAGRFTINLRDRDAVVLGAGDTYVVPRGVEHFPQAAPGTRILMFEPTGTPNTGDEGAVDHLTTTTGVSLD
jgi:mannose-6-phosphate isomerase-like protein (cupin superfamily)